jgi:purine-nucleoside phosphorylase
MQKEKNLYSKVQEAVQAIRKTARSSPKVGIILGTGLGIVRKQMKISSEIDYGKIPHFPKSTVQSHRGNLIFGQFGGQSVVVMEGRFHYYEGYSLEQVTFPVRVMKALGVKTLLVSNAAGGLNPQFQKGDLMLLNDHINFMGVNPLIGPNDDRLGLRFPDMIEPYSKKLLQLAKTSALKQGIPLKEGVYIGVTGPCLETRAEYRMMRAFGADAVGMSTVPEVIAAVQTGLETLAVSVITDICLADALKPVKIEEIIEAANSAGPKLAQVFSGVIEKLSK